MLFHKVKQPCDGRFLLRRRSAERKTADMDMQTAGTGLNDEELRALSWSDFIAGVTEPELIQYLKERRLYLNEPVESGVEL